MALWDATQDGLVELQPSTFTEQGWKERADLQRFLRDQPDVLELGLFIVSEEYGNWADSRRRIDLLGIDSDGRLVVIELKRDDSLEMDLQALRYAAMVANMTVDMVVEAHRAYLDKRGRVGDAGEIVRERLIGNLARPGELDSEKPRIILASSDFGRELTTTVLWLNDADVDIKCIRLRPYRLGDRVLVDVQQLIPLVDAEEYTVRAREKQRETVATALPDVPWTEPDFVTLVERITNPTLRAMFELCSESPDTFVTMTDVRERSQQTPAQARGAFGGFTLILRNLFQRKNWPVDAEWSVTGDGQVSYRLSAERAAWWRKAASIGEAVTAESNRLPG